MNYVGNGNELPIRWKRKFLLRCREGSETKKRNFVLENQRSEGGTCGPPRG